MTHDLIEKKAVYLRQLLKEKQDREQGIADLLDEAEEIKDSLVVLNAMIVGATEDLDREIYLKSIRPKPSS